MEDMIIYWIWLSLACNPSGSTFGKLIKEFDGAKKIYEADGRRVSSIIGFRNSDRTNLENKSLDKAEEVTVSVRSIRWCYCLTVTRGIPSCFVI